MANDRRVVVVVGEGSESATPDRCEMTIGLNVLADTPAEALDAVARLADDVNRVLHERHVAATDIQTVTVSVQDWFDQAEQRVTARAGTYVLSVTVHEVSEVGRLLAALAPVAGDALRLHGIGLTVGDVEPLREVARRRAMEDALVRATQLTEAAGLRLGRVAAIEETPLPGPFTPFARRGALMAASAPMQPVAVEPGSQRVWVQVKVTYEIED